MFFKTTSRFGRAFAATIRYAASPRRVQCAIGWVVVLSSLLGLALPAAAQGSAKAATAPATTRTVLVMGDSLSAAHGLAAAEGWVALTAARVAKVRPGWKIVNASIGGETTAGGASRIEGELRRHRPAVVVIELGANDGLRGLPLAQSRANLERMIDAAKGAGARVLLIGMRMPPNLGRAYTEGFADNYAALARAHELAFVPFLLEPIALDRGAFQDDNLHPVAAAQPRLRDHVWPALEPLLD
ncbi:arylesterase [Marilutibacter chinensis]|uniref:Arylesterase n=1 Tax=Marilutibacter chinensis TaxID=2912247 RepID=A0ABS9HTQ8_9GAMM|nr:arylesterase [Lysobacter chinensis]MCF7222280.1 arylesterase [Lysobacter chinensis]